MINDFITKKEWPLFTSGSRFTLATVLLQEGMQDTWATFDLYVRELPRGRNHLVFAGLEHATEYLLNLTPDSRQLAWMKRIFRFDRKMTDYFRRFRFSGDLWAMPEGTVFFPQEPVIRITAPLIEAQVIEMYLINIIYVQTILASKISRFANATNNKPIALGFNRSYGTDAAMKSTRIAKMFGISTSLAAYEYLHRQQPPFTIGTFHYFIMAFPNERDAFRAYFKRTGGKGFVLVDTYDSVRGIQNFIKVAQEFSRLGIKPNGLQLDSGDLLVLSRQARKLLDKAGLKQVKIFAMSNLDEYKVAALEKKHAPIDVYAGVTGILTPEDAPTLELVYKLVETERGSVVEPKMKTSTSKLSFPGKKQVFRKFKRGRYVGDIIGLADERIPGRKLLQPIIRRGRPVYAFPSLPAIGGYYRREKKKFNNTFFDLSRQPAYRVGVSSKLQSLTKQTKDKISKHHSLDS